MKKIAISLLLSTFILLSSSCADQSQNKSGNKLEKCRERNGVIEKRVDQNGTERQICVDPDGREGPADDHTCFHEKNNTFMHISEAISLAKKGECGNKIISNDYYCNPATGTWWIETNIKMENCAPACVVWIESKKVEINTMCMGAIIGR